MLKKHNIDYPRIIKTKIVGGIAWAFGVTIGFVLISTIVVFVLRQLGGLPVVGGWIASIVQATQDQLVKKNPILPR